MLPVLIALWILMIWRLRISHSQIPVDSLFDTDIEVQNAYDNIWHMLMWSRARKLSRLDKGADPGKMYVRRQCVVHALQYTTFTCGITVIIIMMSSIRYVAVSLIVTIQVTHQRKNCRIHVERSELLSIRLRHLSGSFTK